MAELTDTDVRERVRERYAAAAPESFGPYRTFCGT